MGHAGPRCWPQPLMGAVFVNKFLRVRRHTGCLLGGNMVIIGPNGHLILPPSWIGMGYTSLNLSQKSVFLGNIQNVQTEQRRTSGPLQCIPRFGADLTCILKLVGRCGSAKTYPKRHLWVSPSHQSNNRVISDVGVCTL